MKKRAPTAAVPDEFLLHALMDMLPDLIYFKDRESRFIRVNTAFARLHGLKKPADAAGKTDFDFYPKEFAKAALEVEQEIMRTGRGVEDVEEKLRWPDGRLAWLTATKLPLRDRRGKIIGTFGVSRDISPHKRAEEKLRDSEALYASLIDCLPMNIFRKDLEGRVVYVNRRYCEELGVTPREIMGKTDYDFFPRRLADKYVADDKRVVSTGRVFETVEEHKPPGQKTIKVRVIKSPVYDSQGRVIGVQGVFWKVAADSPE